jgi:hypothetical protein
VLAAVSHAAPKHRELDRRFAEALDRDGGDGHALLPSRLRLRDQQTMNHDRGRRQAGQQSRVLFATLTEAVSANGRPYLKGWAGASNLVAFRGEPDERGRPTWNLYLTERPPRQEQQDRDGVRGMAEAG